jgi:hypothetical protein
MNPKHRFLTGCALGTAALLPLPSLHAALLAGEGFDYISGTPVHGASGGSGWASAWSVYSGGEVVRSTAPGLSYGALPTSGVAATSDLSSPGAGFTYLVRDVPASAAPTLYVSYLLRRDQEGPGNYGGLGLYGAGGSVFAGKSGTTTTFGLEVTGSITSTTTSITTGDVYLLLTCLEFGAVAGGLDRISLYVNPPVDGTIPAVADAVRTDLDLDNLQYLYLNNSGGWTTDEIRVATTWQSAIPEPALLPWAFGAVALLVPVGRRWLRR